MRKHVQHDSCSVADFSNLSFLCFIAMSSSSGLDESKSQHPTKKNPVFYFQLLVYLLVSSGHLKMLQNNHKNLIKRLNLQLWMKRCSLSPPLS